MNNQNFMVLTGAVIILLIAAYFGFQAIDNLGLEPTNASAIVLEKNYRAANTTYTTQFINKRSQVIPHITSEAYLLTLDMGGEKAEAEVSKDLFNIVSVSSSVEVTYERRRLTRLLKVTEVKQ